MYLPRNDKGQLISGIRQVLRPEYAVGFSQNKEPIIDWSFLSKYADENGFDTRNLEKNGRYIIDTQLPYGTVIIRYGSEMGRFSAPKGTDYSELALPYLQDTVEYNEYQVLASKLFVRCIVTKGRVAPGFDSNGGAIQYLHKHTIRNLVSQGVLKRCKIWEIS